MQVFLKIVRWAVAFLFIFSGLIKANDPLGLSYKMQEFFEVWGLHFLSDYTLAFALLMNTFEIIAGVALLLKYPYKTTLYILLGLILFFTFLTGYALFSGKIKTCGCFGDCIPLTPQTSFIKDLVLLFFIIILLIFHKKVKSSIKPLFAIFLLMLTTAIVGYGQYYVLRHLPVIDCLPFKRGNDIQQKMKLPVNAITDSITILMEFEKDGKIRSFDANSFPDDFDSSYTFIQRKEKLVRKGNGVVAPITDFNLFTLNGTDTTEALFNLSTPYVLVFAGQIETNIPWNELIQKITLKNRPIFVVTADKEKAIMQFKQIPILIGDATMIKTVARTNPTILIMNGPVIMDKMSYVDLLEK